jgi:RNA-binding protein Musashi
MRPTDLYGNDDEGLQPVTEELDSPKAESSATTATTTQSSAGSNTVPAEPVSAAARAVPASATQQPATKPVVSAALPVQAIQTYQERNEPAAMPPQQAYTTNMSVPSNGDSAQIPVGERSVRPSEMKDEG